MTDRSNQRRSHRTARETFGRRRPAGAVDYSVMDAMRRIVRRILRTQSQRTGFQAWVLEEARRLHDRHGSVLQGEAFERLIVDRLVCACRDGRFNSVALETNPACPSTWGGIFEMTFAGQPPNR